MKLSRFNVWAMTEYGLALFNTLTCALCVFDDESQHSVREALEGGDIGNVPEEYLAAFAEDGFAVPDDRDELAEIGRIRAERMSRTDEYSLCVVLTMLCNFGCFYCFEKHRSESLSDSLQSAVVKLFSDAAKKAKKISVDWFGGEPLIRFDKLRELNDMFMLMAKSTGVAYDHSITTNGYLLTDQVIDYLKDTPLSLIIVTLDGPQDIHDRCRPLKNGGATFETILGNVRKAVDAGLKVSIRVNVTTMNMGRVCELYGILERYGLKNRVEVNLQAVVSSDTNPCEHCCLSGAQFATIAMKTYKEAALDGWKAMSPAEQMRTLGFCIGEFPHRYILDLAGNIYRCGHMFEGDAVGSLRPDGTVSLDADKNRKWVEKDPLSFPECRDCAFLPVCMGGCMMKRTSKNGRDYCLDWKHDVKSLLEAMIANERTLASLTP